MRSVEAEGATIDEAIGHALELLREDRDRVEIEILDNSSRGLLGFGGKKARIRATVRSPLFTAETDARAVSQETSPPSRDADAVSAARRALEEILRLLGVDESIDVSGPVDGSWCFTISGREGGIVIGRHGQTLDAIEYLLNRIASHASESGFRIELDAEGYRQRRRESVEDTARRAAAKVRETGRPIALSPMSPRDRRIVHLALREMAGVSSSSEGDGRFRHVVIAPAQPPARRQV